MNHRALIPLALTALLVACPAVDDGEEFPGIVECEFDDQPLAWDEEAPDGTVAEDLLEAAEGLHETTGGYVDSDEEIDVTITVDRRGDGPIWRESAGGGCPSYLVVPVEIAFTTSDGVFDEHVEADATHGQGDASLDLRVDLPLSVIDGIYEPEDGTPFGVVLQAEVGAAGASGQVEVRVEGGDEDVAWSSNETWFVFGAR